MENPGIAKFKDVHNKQKRHVLTFYYCAKKERYHGKYSKQQKKKNMSMSERHSPGTEKIRCEGKNHRRSIQKIAKMKVSLERGEIVINANTTVDHWF